MANANTNGTSQIGANGVKTILRYLELRTNGHTLTPSENLDEQRNGADIIESWTDEHGNNHEIWHEVKTDRLALKIEALQPGEMYKTKRAERFKGLVDTRISIPTTIAQPDQRNNGTLKSCLAGTANEFVELIQYCPRRIGDKRQALQLAERRELKGQTDDGWFYKYAEFSDSAERRSLDGHYIWYVNVITGSGVWGWDMDDDLNLWCSRSDNMVIAICVDMKTFVGIVQNKIKANMANMEKFNGDEFSFASNGIRRTFGLLLPMRELWWNDELFIDGDVPLTTIWDKTNGTGAKLTVLSDIMPFTADPTECYIVDDE